MWEFYVSLIPSTIFVLKLTFSSVLLYYVINFLNMTSQWIRREKLGYYGYFATYACDFGFELHDIIEDDNWGIFIIVEPFVLFFILIIVNLLWPVLILIGIWIAIAFKIRSMHDNKITPWTPKDHIWDEIAAHMNPSSSPKAEEVINLLDKVDDIVDRRESCHQK